MEVENLNIKSAPQQRERHNCCVPQCSAVKSPENHLHKVPNDERLRKEWAIAIKTGKPLSKRMELCSRHFKSTDYIPTRGAGLWRKHKTGSIPSENLPLRSHEPVVASPIKRKRAARGDRARKRALWEEPLASGPTTSDNDENLEMSGQDEESTGSEGEDVHLGVEKSVQVGVAEIKMQEIGVHVSDPTVVRLTISLLDDNKRLYSATGIHPIALLESLIKAFEKVAPDSPFGPIQLSTRGRILLTMMKTKLGISLAALAALFSIHVTICSNYFYDCVVILANVLCCMIKWPSKEKIMMNLPKCFKPEYQHTRVILDGYETPAEKSKCITCRVRNYSIYKKIFTVKILMVCTPSGLIVRVPPIFGGRASDKVLTEASEVYDLCDPLDGVMVDKGFAIEDECHNHAVRLIRPPFLRQKAQLSKAESVETAKIGRSRVHVERVIQRVCDYKILDTKIPWLLMPYLHDIVVIVSALVNLGKPILAKDKF